MTDPGTSIAGETGAPNLAVDLLPDNEPGTILLDVSEVDGLDLLGWGTDGWANVVCDVTSVRTNRGATRLQGALTRTEAGTAVIALTDTDRRFDPTVNADAVHPGVQFRVRAWDTAPEPTPVEVRRNVVLNPRAVAGGDVSLTNHGNATATIDGTAGRYKVTSTALAAFSVRIPPASRPATVAPGEQWSGAVTITAGLAGFYSVQIRPTTTAIGVTSAGTATIVSRTFAAGETARVMANGHVVPAGALGVVLIVSGPTSTTIGDTFYVTAVQFERAPVAGAYFDGSTAAVGDGTQLGDIAHAWTGAANASPSIETEVQLVDTPWSTELFTGRIGSDITVDYQRVGAPLVTFTAVDVVSPLSTFTSIGRPDPGAGDGDDLLDRVTRVVTEVGLPASTIASSSDASFVATMPASSLDAGWEDINAAVDAELGRVWVNAADELVVRARGSELSGPVRGTLSDWHGETVADDPGDVHCCYLEPVVRFGTDSLVNRAIGARRVPTPAGGGTATPSAIVQADDELSQARWSARVPVTHEDRSLELRDDAQLQPWAEWLVLAAAEPELRVDSVVLAPRGNPAAWPAVCATDIGDRWHFRMHPEIGPTIMSTLGVLGIAHDITPDSWVVTLTTVKAPTPGEGNPRGWVILGDATDAYATVLDSGDVLAPFGGTVGL